VKVLLTGGHGMVGRNLREHPGVAQWDLRAPSRAELDLADFDATQSYLRSWTPDVVIHAAGKVGGIQANLAAPLDFLVQNLDLGRNVVLAARAAGVPRVVNLGSSCMYPPAAAQPFNESSLFTGSFEASNGGYGLAKATVARLCSYAMREDPALRYQTLVPCNLYGRHDHFEPERSHLVAAALAKVHAAKVEGHETVEIWGDGSARREFMYCGDLADAIVRFVQAPPPGDWDCLNIGMDAEHSVDDYYRAVAEVVGWHGRFVHSPSRPVGMLSKRIDTARQRQWGWSPRVSLEEGLALAYAFYLDSLP
jgi:GDP-L-fucose synthase